MKHRKKKKKATISRCYESYSVYIAVVVVVVAFFWFVVPQIGLYNEHGYTHSVAIFTLKKKNCRDMKQSSLRSLKRNTIATIFFYNLCSVCRILGDIQ